MAPTNLKSRAGGYRAELDAAERASRDEIVALQTKRLGWSLPVFKFFPWHWPQFSGSIYDGSRGFTSLSCHLLVVTASLAMLYLYRDSLFAELPVASGP